MIPPFFDRCIDLFIVSVYNNINNVVFKVVGGGCFMPEANLLLERAINETANLKPGEVFLVKDLFRGYEWNRISRSERLLLGTLFLNYIKTHPDIVDILDKTSSGQQRYAKKKA